MRSSCSYESAGLSVSAPLPPLIPSLLSFPPSSPILPVSPLSPPRLPRVPPPSSVYFRCSSQALASLHHCPPHTLFLEAGAFLGNVREEEEDGGGGACIPEDEFRLAAHLRKVGASNHVQGWAGFSVEGQGDVASAYPSGGHRGVSLRELGASSPGEVPAGFPVEGKQDDAGSAYPSGGHRGVSLREVAGVSRAVGLLKSEPVAAAAGAGGEKLAGGDGGDEGAGGTGEAVGAMRSQLEVNQRTGGSGGTGGSSQAAPSSPTSSSAPPPDPQALAELNALLAFKASVIVFNDLLASWTLPLRLALRHLLPRPPWWGAEGGGAEYDLVRPGPGPEARADAHPEVRSGGELGRISSPSSPSLPLIPLQFSALTALTNLSLSSNRDYREMAGLIGAFPTHLTACSSLQVLSLTGHRLLGSLPDSISLFSSLRHLQITLQSLNVSHNSLTGTLDTITTQLRPSPIFTLGLAENLLEGPVPAAIGNLTTARAIDVSDNRLLGSLPLTLSQLQVLRSLSVSGNNLSSFLPEELSALSLLTSLDVSRNDFNGPIPPQLAPPFLPRLLYLNLSHNHFFGAIPYGFSNTNTSATALDFSYNDLLGQIPFNTTGTGTPLSASALQGNLGLCGGFGYASCPVAPYESTGGFSPGAIAGIALGCAAFVAALLVLLVLLWLWLFARRRGPSLDGGTMLVFEKLGFKLTVTDVVDATEDFSNKFLLGRGGFGSVYRATLQDGRSVAIKRLALGSSQGQREFEAEMNTLGNVRHRNLVVLVAAYLSPPPAQERLLIYDFLPGGSLDQVLAREMGKDSPMRRWAVRRNILEGTARALKYLHQDCTPGIIHRDMKPANILLDENLEAKVADFGLAREADASRTHMSTSVFGTVGYLSPEYSQRGRLSFKSDVFAFGVLVLQVITGKLPTDSDVAERGLARWVGMHTVASFVDERIDDALLYEDEIMGVVTLALQCTQTVPADRPSMPEALE
ncbi:unnamed protein product, partial [Closterium sp. Yama58-4]